MAIICTVAVTTIPFVAFSQLDSATISKSIHALDSNLASINHRIDSAQLKAEQLMNPDMSIDALVGKLRARQRAAVDSIKAFQELDSVKNGLRYKIDSLRTLNLSTDQYTRKLDSLTQLDPSKYLEEYQAKALTLKDKINRPINELESKLNSPIQNVQAKVNEKLELMRKEGGDDANIPGNLNAPGVNLPGVDVNVPDLNRELGLDIPSLDGVNPLEKIENPLKGQVEQFDELKSKADQIRNFPNEQISKLKSIDEVQAVEGKLGQANAAIDKVQAYQEDVTHIVKGEFGEVKEIPQAIEQKVQQKVMELDEVKELQTQTGQWSRYQELLKKGNDPKAMMELAKTEGLKYATNHFAGQTEALEAAMLKVSKLKARFPEVKSLKDLPKRAPNQMKGKPFVERLVPGLTLQIQKTTNVLVDFNPVLSYRITGRLNAGAGWNERASFSEWNKTVSTERIYGPRAFTSFLFRKGFSLKAEGEKMNVFIPTFVPNPEDGSRAWIWSVFVGFKKDYTFFGKVKGNFQVLYNIYDDRDSSPYLERLNVRMGWEFPMKKKPKPAADQE